MDYRAGRPRWHLGRDPRHACVADRHPQGHGLNDGVRRRPALRGHRRHLDDLLGGRHRRAEPVFERISANAAAAVVSDAGLRKRAWFLCESDDDTIVHALEPLANGYDQMFSSFHSCWPERGRAVSSANALITLWLASGSQSTPDQLASAYDICLDITISALFGPGQSTIRQSFRVLVFRQLAADQRRLSANWLNSVINRI